jgi:hypothetical protein
MFEDILFQALARLDCAAIATALTEHRCTPPGWKYQVELVRSRRGRPSGQSRGTATEAVIAAAQVQLETVAEAMEGRRPTRKRAVFKAAEALNKSIRSVERPKTNSPNNVTSVCNGAAAMPDAESPHRQAGERAITEFGGEIEIAADTFEVTMHASDIELQLETEVLPLSEDGPRGQPGALLVGIGNVAALDLHATKVNGGKEVYREAVYLRIQIPGQRGFEYLQPLREEDKLRWPQAWRRYLDQTAVVGTRLDQWAEMPRSIAKLLQSRGIPTVEALGAVNDANLNIGLHGNQAREWRDRARKQLGAVQAAAAAQTIADEKAVLERKVAELTESMAQMQAFIAATGAGRKKPPRLVAVETSETEAAS